MNRKRMQLKANLMSSHSPEVAACAVISPRHTCMSVTQCKASSSLRGVSVLVAIKKCKISFHLCKEIVSYRIVSYRIVSYHCYTKVA